MTLTCNLSVIGKLRQEDCQSEASLDYRERLSQEKKIVFNTKDLLGNLFLLLVGHLIILNSPDNMTESLIFKSSWSLNKKKMLESQDNHINIKGMRIYFKHRTFTRPSICDCFPSHEFWKFWFSYFHSLLYLKHPVVIVFKWSGSLKETNLSTLSFHLAKNSERNSQVKYHYITQHWNCFWLA